MKTTHPRHPNQPNTPESNCWRDHHVKQPQRRRSLENATSRLLAELL